MLTEDIPVDVGRGFPIENLVGSSKCYKSEGKQKKYGILVIDCSPSSFSGDVKQNNEVFYPGKAYAAV